jgi:hypothetical protein
MVLLIMVLLIMPTSYAITNDARQTQQQFVWHAAVWPASPAVLPLPQFDMNTVCIQVEGWTVS